MHAKKSTLTAFVGIVLCLSGHCVAQQKPIDKVRVLYENAIADIKSLEVEYSFTFIGDVMDEAGNWVPSDEVPIMRKFCLEGEKFYWHENDLGSRNSSASAWSGDRFFVYSPPELELKPGERNFQFQASVPSEFYGNYHPANMTGIVMPKTRGKLAELLVPQNNGRVRFEDGKARIDFAKVETPYGSTRLNVELSVKQDHMPSLFRFTSTKSKDWWSEWTVTKFLKAKNITGEDKWFPAEIQIEQSGKAPTILIKTIRVRLNEDIPDEIFDPRLEPGTVVADLDKNESFIVGSSKSVDKRVGKMLNIADDLRSHSHRYRASWIFASIAVVAGVIAIIVWRRQNAR